MTNKKYVVTKQYEVTLPEKDSEEWNDLVDVWTEELGEREWELVQEKDNWEHTIIVWMVECFHVGNFTSDVTELCVMVHTEDQEKEIRS